MKKTFTKKIVHSILLGSFIMGGLGFIAETNNKTQIGIKSMRDERGVDVPPGWYSVNLSSNNMGLDQVYLSTVLVDDVKEPYYEIENIFIVDDVNDYAPVGAKDRDNPTGAKYGYLKGSSYQLDSTGVAGGEYRGYISAHTKDGGYLDSYLGGLGNSNSQIVQTEDDLEYKYGNILADFNTDKDHAFLLSRRIKKSLIEGEENWDSSGGGASKKEQAYSLKREEFLFTEFSKENPNMNDYYHYTNATYVFRSFAVQFMDKEKSPRFAGTVYLSPSVTLVDPKKLIVKTKIKKSFDMEEAWYNLGEVKITLHNDLTTVDYGNGLNFDIEELDQEIILNKDNGDGTHDGKVWINGKESKTPEYTKLIESRESDGVTDNFITKDQALLDDMKFTLSTEYSSNPDKDKWNTTSSTPSSGRLIFWPEVNYTISTQSQVLQTNEGKANGIVNVNQRKSSKVFYPYDVQQPVFTSLEVKNSNFNTYPFDSDTTSNPDKSTYVSNEITFTIDTQTDSETTTLPTGKPTNLKTLELVSRPVGGNDSEWVTSSDVYTFDQNDFDVTTGSTKHNIDLQIGDKALKQGESKEFAVKTTYSDDDLISYSDTLLINAPSMEPIGESNVTEFSIDENSYASIDSENGSVNLKVNLDTVSKEEANPGDGGNFATGVSKLEILDKDDNVIETVDIDDSKIDEAGIIDETIQVNANRQAENTYKLKIYSDAGIYTSTTELVFAAPAPGVSFDTSDVTNSDFVVINNEKVTTKLSFTIDGTTIEESDASKGDKIATTVNSITIKGLGADKVINTLSPDSNGVINITTDDFELDQGTEYNGVKVGVNYDELNGTQQKGVTEELINTTLTTPAVEDAGFQNQEASLVWNDYTPPTTGDKGDVNYDVNYSFDTTSINEINDGSGTLKAPITIDSIELTDSNTRASLGKLNAGEFDYNETDGVVNATFKDVTLKEATDYTLYAKTTWHYSNEPTTSHETSYSQSFRSWESKPTAPTEISFTKGDYVIEADDTLSTTFDYSFDTTTAKEAANSNYQYMETKVSGVKITSSAGGEIEETNLTSDANGIYSGELELKGISPLQTDVDFTLVITYGENQTSDSVITEDTPALGVMEISDEDVVVNGIETSYSAMRFDLFIQDLDRASSLDKYDDYKLSEVKITNNDGQEFIAKPEDVNNYDPAAGLNISIFVTGLKPAHNGDEDTFAKQINEGEYKLIVNTVDGNGIEKAITIDETSNDVNIDGQKPLTPTGTEKPGDLDNIISEVNIKPETISEDGSFNFEVKIDVDDATFDEDAEKAFINSFQLTYDGGKEITIEPLQLVTTGTKAATTKVYASKASGLPAGNHEITASYKVEDKVIHAQVNVDFEGTTVSIPKSSHFPWWIIIVILLLLTVIGAAIAAVFFFIILPWSIVPSETQIKTGNKVSITLNKKYDAVVEKLSDSYLYIEDEGYAYSITEDDKGRAVINIDGLNMKKLEKVSNIKFSSDEKDIKVKGTIEK